MIRPLAVMLLVLALPMLHAQDTRRARPLASRKPPTRTGGLPLKYVGPPTVPAITAGDLMTRLYKFADDSMMGRMAGTAWNDKGTDYIAAELSRIGLRPAGEGGTYFQQPLERSELASASLKVNGNEYEVWKDYVPREQGGGARSYDSASVVFAGTYGDTTHYPPSSAIAGRIVLLAFKPASNETTAYASINRAQLTARFPDAAAIAVTQLDYVPPGFVDQAYRSSALRVRQEGSTTALPSFFYVTNAVAADMMGASLDGATPGQAGRTVRGHATFRAVVAPGRNVVAVLEGADPLLKGQYVAIGAHNDHIGFNHTPAEHDSVKALMRIAAPQGADDPPPSATAAADPAVRRAIDALRQRTAARMDSIYNGADDDGSGTVGVLEIAEAFAHAKVRPKRSVLFVFHVGEEEGMLGSGYFADHPTVPRDSIVAQLNIDMIGRGGADDITGTDLQGKLLHGGPGYLQLIGSRRLSTELGDLIETVNSDRKLGFRFDYSLDANGHPQNIYCRSDHYSYARHGIPIAFFTTGGHADYHQVTDEPQYIDYARATSVSKLVYDAALRIANLDHRVVVDKRKPDLLGGCQQ